MEENLPPKCVLPRDREQTSSMSKTTIPAPHKTSKDVVAEGGQEKRGQKNTVVNDSVHGHIELPALCMEIINTPQFHRLRSIKQLGCAYYVYPGASHNRFEHSIGVCHLAGKLATALKRRQENLKIDDKDILCVQIAGLCHDLGHGPFSHLFDKKFLPEINDDKKTLTHEDASVKMFDKVIEEIKHSAAYRKANIDENDILFIKDLIGNRKEKEGPEEKKFLYDIVSNKTNGIDVDKWDYFARDCHMLGIKNNFDHNRMIQSARVIDKYGERKISYRDKDVWNLYDMFHTRYTLHIRAYQHKATRIIEEMVKDAMIIADDHIKISTKQGEKKMSDAFEEMEVLMKMTDDFVFSQILDSKCKEAKDLVQRVQERNLYKFVGQTLRKGGKIWEDNKKQSDQIKKEICKILETMEEGKTIKAKDFIIDIFELDYGAKDTNPVDRVYFYAKTEQNKAFRIRKEQVSLMLPDVFLEQHIRIYARRDDAKCIEKLKEAFTDWCRDQNYPLPIGATAAESSLSLKSKTICHLLLFVVAVVYMMT